MGMRVSLFILLATLMTQTSFAGPKDPISGPNAKPLSIQFNNGVLKSYLPAHAYAKPPYQFVVFQEGKIAYSGKKDFKAEENSVYKMDIDGKKWLNVDPTKPYCILNFDNSSHMLVESSQGDVLDDSVWEFQSVSEGTDYNFATNVKNGTIRYFTGSAIKYASLVVGSQDVHIKLKSKKGPDRHNFNNIKCLKGYKAGYPDLEKFDDISDHFKREEKRLKEIRSTLGIKSFEKKDLDNIFKTLATIKEVVYPQVGSTDEQKQKSFGAPAQ